MVDFNRVSFHVVFLEHIDEFLQTSSSVNATLSGSAIDVEGPSYWHVGVFQEPIAILLYDCTQHEDINSCFQADLCVFALPCIDGMQVAGKRNTAGNRVRSLLSESSMSERT